MCRACGKTAKLFGVYCPACMTLFRKQYRYNREIEAYYHALNFGAGDLWEWK